MGITYYNTSKGTTETEKISEETKCILIKPFNKILTLRIFNIGLSRKIIFFPFFLCFTLDNFLYALQYLFACQLQTPRSASKIIILLSNIPI